jgi:hypothetical protein
MEWRRTMMTSIERAEEIMRKYPGLRELWENPPPLPPPKEKPTVTAEVSPTMAEAVRDNPESFRVAAKGADGVVRFEPAKVLAEQLAKLEARRNQPPRVFEGTAPEYVPLSRVDENDVVEKYITSTRAPRSDVVEVREVDAQGRPVLVQTFDPEMAKHPETRGVAYGVRRFDGKSNVTHIYDPMKGLDR